MTRNFAGTVEIAFLHQLADLADAQTLSRFRGPIAVEAKHNEGETFDPVTDADRRAEIAMRALIRERFPGHAILGEEYGPEGESDFCWVLDPVDGTKPFICGIPVWGTLIGLTYRGVATHGMMSQPFTGERFWADGKQAWRSGPQGSGVMTTRKGLPLNQAILHTTSPEPIARTPDVNFAALHSATLMTRYGGECYAMAMLAAGQIDLCLEYALQPYDIVAFVPIVEQAGGVVTTLSGDRPEAGGRILASGCPRLHDEALKILNS